MVLPNNLGPDLSFDLKGYSNSDYAGCNMDKKRTSAEAKYVAAAGCCANILWMKSQLTDYDIIYEKVPIFCDNTSAIAISNNTVLHSRTKHIDIRYHFIRDHILKGDIELHFIPTQYQLADIFTKPLDDPTFKRLIVELAFIRDPTQYKEYLSEFWYTTKTLDDSKIWVSTPTDGIRGDIGGKTGGMDQISNNDATILYCLANGVKVDYAKPIWEDIIHKLKKKTKEKVVPYPRFISLLLEYMMPEYNNEELTINLTQVFSVHNWELKPNQTEGPPFTDHMKAICNLDVPVDSKALKPSSQTEEVPQGKKAGAKSGLRRKQSSKHTSESRTKASKSKTGQSNKETQSSLAKDKSPSHPSPPTLVVGEMHKEAQQTAGGPTSLGATSEEGVHPQLSSSDSIAEADPGLSAPNDSIPAQQDIRSAFFTPDSPKDEPIIILDESKEEEEVAKDKDTHASSYDSQKDDLEQQKAKAEAEVSSLKARPSYPNINQLTDLLVTSLKPEFSKLLASHDFASCLPNALKELPSKFTELSREIKELKKHVQDMEIKLPGDLKEILTKLETFTSTISYLSSQEKLKTLNFLSNLLNKVTDTLNRFATMMENASGAARNSVPLVGQASASPAEGEKNTTKDVETNLQNELVNLLGIDIVEQYHNKKLLFDKYYDKMLKKEKSQRS
ncbi:hypothetical protein Tco_0706213 [Tanacetum coccineum]|uniref:Retrovirus-related Pol polyprotein from transposon TNT 1-94 n=1 Tax=Tanacetum coccineum TaxID=301880 RepID=A0ABQ4Y8B7_9ASTR